MAIVFESDSDHDSEARQQALGELRAELAEVERRLQEFPVLQVRQRRLSLAINALAMLDTPIAEDGSAEPVRASEPTTERGNFARVNRVLAGMAHPNSPLMAAHTILSAIGVPLHISKIIGLIQAKGWFTDREYESLRGSLASAMDKSSASGDIFTKPDKATYGLRRFAGMPGNPPR